MKTQFLASAVAAAIVLAGCATTSPQNLYTGPERSPDQVATVIVPWQIQVRSVNGQNVPMSLIGDSDKESTLRVLPGAQAWDVRYYDPFADDRRDRSPHAVDRTGIVSLHFTAEAAHVYRLNFETPEQNPALRDAKEQVRFSVVGEDGAETAPVERRPPDSIDGGRTSTSASPPVTLEQATLGELKNGWRVAGPAERKAFLDWVDEEHQP